MRRFTELTMALALCLLAVPAASACELWTFALLYTPQGTGHFLAKIDPQTGSVSVFPNPTGHGSPPGLDFPLGGATLYGGWNHWLITFNVSTGQGTPVGKLIGNLSGTPVSPQILPALAFSPDGRLFGFNFGALWEINPASGAMTVAALLVDEDGNPPDFWRVGMDFAPDGTLYFIAGGQYSCLFTVDTNTGLITPVGAGFVGFYFADTDLAIAADGTIYGIAQVHVDQQYGDQQLTVGPYLFTIDPLTGLASSVTRLTPPEGYVVGTGALGWGPTLHVTIDVKPGSDPNSINLGSGGVVPVAILSSESFDATLVDADTVNLAGAGVAVRGNGKNTLAHIEDVNQDGLDDLVTQIESQGLTPEKLQAGLAILNGWTIFGAEFIGYDQIVLVPPEG